MPNRVVKEAQRQGGKINFEAASALVGHVGNDTHMANQEIDKLLQYVDFKRAIELEDVEELTAQSGQADVFEMVDSLSASNTRLALTQMHKLLETQDPLQLFAMVVRQFRLLIQARELLDEGQPSLIQAELHIPSFVADKLANQARRFTMPRLESLHHHLLCMDEDLKTGQMPLELALDTFVAGLAN
jgi:DNA polymerase-3 subunit delta